MYQTHVHSGAKDNIISGGASVVSRPWRITYLASIPGPIFGLNSGVKNVRNYDKSYLLWVYSYGHLSSGSGK